MKTALITGITGQDGSYLAELLIEKGYMVHGIVRRSSLINTHRIDHIFDHPQMKLHYGDLTDAGNLIHVIQKCKPDEIYNLAAQSHVKVSFELLEYTGNVDGLGTLRILEAVRIWRWKIRFVSIRHLPQNFMVLFKKFPEGDYSLLSTLSLWCCKTAAYWITKNYRESYGMYACTGILFNHESPRRGGDICD